MGAEARCELRVGGASHAGKALLETDELLFRGDARDDGRGFRLAIPLSSIRSVSHTDGAVTASLSTIEKRVSGRKVGSLPTSVMSVP